MAHIPSPPSPTEEQMDDMTREALRDVDSGRTFSHEEVVDHFSRKRQGRPKG